MRNLFATTQPANQYGTEVLGAFIMVLGKHVPNATLCHYLAKLGGINIAVAEDRCHLTIWTAWLSSLPSVMRVMGLDDIGELFGQCPHMGGYLHCPIIGGSIF